MHLDPQTTDGLIKVGAAIASSLCTGLIGFWFGRRHSIFKFLKEYKRLLKEAKKAIKSGDQRQLESICRILVDHVMTWRRIEARFQELLNGLIDELSNSLKEQEPNFQQWTALIRAIDQAFRSRRIAIETELERSKI